MMVKRFGFLAMLAAALLLTAGHATAIERVPAATTKVGFHGGLTFAKWTGDAVPDGLDSRTGISLGGFVAFSVGNTIQIQPELNYVQKGAKESGQLDINGQIVDAEVTVKLDYIEVPVLVKFTFPTQSSVSPHLYVGPAFGLNVTSKAKVEVTSGGQTGSAEEEFTGIKDVEFGLLVGGGVNFAVGRGEIFVTGRYNLGLSSIDDSAASEDVKNSALSVLAGYAFPIGN